jgi:hypothetical protein
MPSGISGGRLFDQYRSILQITKDIKLCANYTFSVNFTESSRKARDARPLSRWGVIVTSAASHFKKSLLKVDGLINGCDLVPTEVCPARVNHMTPEQSDPQKRKGTSKDSS